MIHLTQYRPCKFITILFLCLGLQVINSSCPISASVAHAKKRGKRSNTKQSSKLHLETWRDQGKQQYRAGNYRVAKNTFIRLVQHNSRAYSDYLLLARSANRAEDYIVASVAYQIYFELAKSKGKPQARSEYTEVKKYVSNGMDKRKRKAHKSRCNEVLKLIKSGELFEKSGAYAAIKDLHQEGIFDPSLNRIHTQFKKALLAKQSKRLLAALSGNSDQKELSHFVKTLSAWGKQSWGDQERAKTESIALDTFVNLRKSPEQGMEQLTELVKSNYDLPPKLLRTSQMLALMNAKRHQEVYLMADGLLRSLEAQTTLDERSNKDQKDIQVLQAIKFSYGRLLNKEDNHEVLSQALMSTPAKIKAQLETISLSKKTSKKTSQKISK